MRKRKRTSFEEYAITNVTTFDFYVDRLTELAISMFEWKNLPDGIDERFLELTLFTDGQAVFFKDEIAEQYACLQVTTNGRLNKYRVPIIRMAYAVNGYNKELTIDNSVIIYNNRLRQPGVRYVNMYAKRLWDLDRTIDVNAKAQKTPILVQCTEAQRLTLLNLYKDYDGNSPFIFGDKNLDLTGLKSINTGAPYVADKIYTLKTQIWNEALTYLGISNINIQKKERLITDEVVRNQGGTIASRYSRLKARRQACEEINKMFGLNISVSYSEDFSLIDESGSVEKDGVDDE